MEAKMAFRFFFFLLLSTFFAGSANAGWLDGAVCLQWHEGRSLGIVPKAVCADTRHGTCDSWQYQQLRLSDGRSVSKKTCLEFRETGIRTNAPAVYVQYRPRKTVVHTAQSRHPLPAVPTANAGRCGRSFSSRRPVRYSCAEAEAFDRRDAGLLAEKSIVASRQTPIVSASSGDGAELGKLKAERDSALEALSLERQKRSLLEDRLRKARSSANEAERVAQLERLLSESRARSAELEEKGNRLLVAYQALR